MLRLSLFLGFGFATAFACLACGGADGSVDEEGDDALGELKVDKDQVKVAGTVPLLEVSALGLRDGKLLAIGDREFKIVTGGAIDRSGKIEVSKDAVTRDLSVKKGGEPALFPPNVRGAQWEGIAADGTGRLFVLEENPGRIFVLDKDASKLIHTITLSVPESGDEWTAAWNDSANSRGEGFVLLKNGHVLVAKEKDPKRIVEFGPKDDKPAGFKPGAQVTKETFKVSGEASNMVPLAAWKLKGEADKFGDISELAVGPDGLYVLSDESRAIARIASLDPKKDEAEANQRWKLPFDTSDEDKKTEGLVILPGSGDRTALVALDGPNKDNVYVVTLADE